MNNIEQTKSFKTNIKCGGCIATVKPFLDQILPEESWKVHTEDKDKILTVQCHNISWSEVIAKVQEAGFKIEEID